MMINQNNLIWFLFSFLFAFAILIPAWAQETAVPADTTESDVITAPLDLEMETMPYVRLRSLDKVTARTLTFDAKVGATVTFGNLYIRAQTCRQSQPIDKPESAAFLQIWEDQIAKESAGAENTQWVFSGWMFSSSPGLSHMDHPVYDVWVLDCLREKTL